MVRLSNIIVILYYLTDATISRRNDYVSILRDFEAKIVGGMPVRIEEFPHSVQFFNFGAMCAGSILTSRAVLTAAHCFDINKKKDDMSIFAEANYIFDYKATMYDVFGFYIHKDYNKSVMFSNDIAMLFVDRDIHLGKKAKKAIIINTDEWTHERGNHFIATGWGYTSYGGSVSKVGLMMTKLKYVPVKKCMKIYNRTVLSKDMFCLYGDGKRDTCQGDSGGAVLWKGMIVGITSHGEECAEKSKPSIYASVWYFRHWIHNALRTFKANFCRYSSALNHSCTKQKLSLDTSSSKNFTVAENESKLFAVFK